MRTIQRQLIRTAGRRLVELTSRTLRPTQAEGSRCGSSALPAKRQGSFAPRRRLCRSGIIALATLRGACGPIFSQPLRGNERPSCLFLRRLAHPAIRLLADEVSELRAAGGEAAEIRDIEGEEL